MSSYRTRLVRIGNSRGLRIPKALLEQAGLEGDVELNVQHEQLVVRASRQPRAGWDEQFRAMAECGDDAMLIHDLPTDWDDTEWEW